MGYIVRSASSYCARNKGIQPNRKSVIWNNLYCLRICAAVWPVFVLAACSVTTPIASLLPDEEIATGSIRAPKSPFSEQLGAEDWRRAKSALAVALDPQGTGTPVKWENQETRLSGSFAPAGAFLVHKDLVCRPFHATLNIRGAQSTPHGLACRQGPGEWNIERAPVSETHLEKSNQLRPGGLF